MKNNIKELRRQHSLSQQQLADILDVSRQTINSIENGRYDPSLPLAFSFARYFKLSIETIFEDENFNYSAQ